MVGVTDPNLDEVIEREGWQVDGDKTAIWALRKLADAEREVRRCTELHADERERIDEWLDHATRSPLRTIEFMRAALIDYRHRLEDEKPDLPPTYKLPHGTITRRSQPMRVVIDDLGEFCDWALANDRNLLKFTPAKTPLATYRHTLGDDPGESKLATEDGEPIPGVRIVRPEPVYDAKADA